MRSVYDPRVTRAGWLILAALLVVQALLVLFEPPFDLTGDEPYYVSKARYLSEHGRLPRVDPAALAAEHGSGGNSDWRPQAYAVFLALVSGGDFTLPRLRTRTALAQFALIAAAVLLAYRAIARGASNRRRLAAAIILGIAPWPFAFVTSIGPDSPNAACVFFALYLLWRWVVAPERRLGLLFAASLLMSFTLHIRPEMIAVAPLMVALAALLKRPRAIVRYGVVGACAFAILLGVQLAYRTYFVGRFTPSIYGGLHIVNAGAFAWANSWLGSEHEAYDFVYAVTDGAARVPPLPERAFANSGERATVTSLVARVRGERRYSRAVDEQFAALARERNARDPFTTRVLTRLWHPLHQWVNLETSTQLLYALAPLPRMARRGLLASLLALKLALLGAFGWKVLRRRFAEPQLATILAAYVIARTLLTGFVLNWMVNRYAVSAWLPLLAVVLLAASTRDVPSSDAGTGRALRA
ncbi:MAG TPA: hypothetical protein VF824_07195 [Thermoanaerobaculia bacterium]|jgi:hypothetical protein